MITVAVFDAKSYDRDYLTQAALGTSVRYQFLEHRLSGATAATAASAGASAVCFL